MFLKPTFTPFVKLWKIIAESLRQAYELCTTCKLFERSFTFLMNGYESRHFFRQNTFQLINNVRFLLFIGNHFVSFLETFLSAKCFRRIWCGVQCVLSFVIAAAVGLPRHLINLMRKSNLVTQAQQQ